MSEMTVKLPPEASEQLRNQVIAIIGEAVTHAGKHANAGEWLKGYTGVASYLGCGTDAVKKMVVQGLQPHTIQALPKVQFFNRNEVDQFLLADGYLN
ncbi:hypothetical protein [Secundilactobacillus yichangensis]|uniref:hypothetical protein n=1 Tax=Secundilactobacillus yichangensis TaxID=2799580 RepID=UPI0019443613|nr:hypothetical protein [Secundilactobacillus yichangensis]